jgi:hypothetical protein
MNNETRRKTTFNEVAILWPIREQQQPSSGVKTGCGGEMKINHALKKLSLKIGTGQVCWHVR